MPLGVQYMGDLSSSIKYLYEKFFLRDILSFITPGSVVIFFILLFWYDSSDILSILKDIHFLVYIPIFGFLFIVGFVLQFLGISLRIIRSSRYDDQTFNEKWQLFHRITRDESEMQLQLER